MKWFKHYSKAHQDRAIEKLIMEFGYAGYGLYFYCLEIIAGTVEIDNITFELEPDIEILAHRGRMDTVLVGKIMHRCIELGLFEIADSGRITCLKLAKYIEKSATSNTGMRAIIESLKGVKNHDAVRKNHDGVMTPSEKVMTEPGLARKSHDGARFSQGNPDQIRLDEKREREEEREFTPELEDEPPAPSSQGSLAIVEAKKVPAKKSDLPPPLLAVFHAAREAFEASPRAKGIMYQDKATTAREMKALKTIVERASNLCPDAPSAFLAQAMDRYKGMVNGKLQGKASWTPSGLATDWVWRLVLEGMEAAPSPEEQATINAFAGILSKKAAL